MIAFAPFQALLDAIGWVLARIFDLIPNYGISIIVLTLPSLHSARSILNRAM